MEQWRSELYHHGILGMKWGVRRYQNPDGTYTAAGRRRYGLDLDLNDKSRRNIAKIRTGEANRKLDVAKSNNSTNTTRIAELQGRVRSAKRNEKIQKRYDKGAARVAKGETITGNYVKGAAAYGASVVASYAFTAYLNKQLDSIAADGMLTPGHMAVASAMNKVGSYALRGAALAYNAKKMHDNSNIRSYYRSNATGDNAIKRVGSTEYQERLEREKKRR